MKVEYLDHMGTDLTVANSARVSFSKHRTEFDASDRKGSDLRLLRYLANSNPPHWAPFAHPQISLRITAPIPVARQLFKHKVGLTENEVSRRYVDDEPEFFYPETWRKRAPNVKQGSSDEVLFELRHDMAEETYMHALDVSENAYRKLLALGVAPEQARLVLPQAMYTQWIWTGSLYAFSRVCKQRLDSHAQAETREVAEQISEICRGLFPHSWHALMGDA